MSISNLMPSLPNGLTGRPRRRSTLSRAALLPVLCLSCQTGSEVPGTALLRSSRQHVLVMVEQPRDSTGWMFRYAKNGDGWQVVGSPVQITVGAGGVGKEREGDKRAPTGAYPLTTVFGYEATGPAGLRMPYLPLRPETECIDDPESDQYNRIVNPSELPTGKTWQSSEMMRRDLHNGDQLYKLGVVVGYNAAARRDSASGKGAGSCIFLHIWRSSTSPTVGCTAMAEDDMSAMLTWLDPKASPILVQGTRQDLEILHRAGLLPYPVPMQRMAS